LLYIFSAIRNTKLQKQRRRKFIVSSKHNTSKRNTPRKSGSVNALPKDHPVLSHDDQLRLVKDWQDNSNKESLDKLVLSNIRIVTKEAYYTQKRNSHLSVDDLIQEGMAGLLKAANMFDPSHDVKFITYAMLWVKANIRSHTMNTRSIVKLGTTRDDRILFNNLSKVSREAEKSGIGGELKIDYIAKKLGVERDSVIKMIGSIKGYDTRLDAPLRSVKNSKSEILLVDTLEDESSGEQEIVSRASNPSKASILLTIVDSLPDDESKILRARYLSDDPKTLRELEKEMSISREWIRKLEMRALDRVKKRLKKDYGISDILDI